MTAIRTEGLTKEFGDVVGVRDLDLEIEEGEIYGFLGPNGAGKSTTINILLDFVRPTRGKATVLGYDSREDTVKIRENSGVLPEDFEVYERLTGRKHIEFAVRMKGADDDPDEILDRVGLGDVAGRKAGGYSKGMKQRLALGMALVGQPDLLILDEPSTGLDPNGAREMREIVREENERGATVFFSSHILEQVEAVCDRVGILKAGELIAENTIEGLREEMGSESMLYIEVENPPQNIEEVVGRIDKVTQIDVNGRNVTVGCRDDSIRMDVLNAIEDSGGKIKTFSTEEASLEDLFAAYTTNKEPKAETDDVGQREEVER